MLAPVHHCMGSTTNTPENLLQMRSVARPFRDGPQSVSQELLEGDGSASCLNSFLGFVGSLLVGSLKNGAGGAVNESFCFAESEAGECTKLFDDLDLLVTSS